MQKYIVSILCEFKATLEKKGLKYISLTKDNFQ